MTCSALDTAPRRKRYIPTGAVADVISASESTVRRLARAGLLPPPVRLGGRCLWDADELESFLESRKGGEGD